MGKCHLKNIPRTKVLTFNVQLNVALISHNHCVTRSDIIRIEYMYLICKNIYLSREVVTYSEKGEVLKKHSLKTCYI